MRSPYSYDVQVVTWEREFYELGIQWVMEVHRDDIEAAKMNGATEGAAVAFLQSIEANPSSSLYGILVDGAPAGMVGVLGQNPFSRSAELMIFLDKQYRGKGLGRIVMRDVIERLDSVGFEKLHAFAASTLSKNTCRRLGFVEEPIGLTMMVKRRDDGNGV